MNSLTGEPIRFAHVVYTCPLETDEQKLQSYGAMTNENGEFSITAVQPGHCSVDVQSPGYFANRLPAAIMVSAGAVIGGVKLLLTPQAVITGHVLDGAGEPVSGVAVKAEGSVWGNEGVTDELGRYRIWGLSPCQCRVKAIPQIEPYPPEFRPDGSVERRDVATYYPSSATAKMAQRLQVKAGTEISGIDIRLVSMPVTKVSGRMTPAMANGFVQVLPHGRITPIGPDGNFVLWGLSPGKYTLRALGGAFMSAPLEVVLDSERLENLELKVMDAFGISGQVRFADDRARRPQQLSPAKPTAPEVIDTPRRIEFHPAQLGMGPGMVSVLNDDDSFVLTNVFPGRYSLAFSPGPGYVESINLGDRESAGDILEVRDASTKKLTITVNSNFCQVSGAVNGTKGPIPYAQVVLVPEADPTRARIVKADSGGNYRFDEVSPGTYRLAAVDDDFRLTTQTDVLEDYSEVAATLVLGGGDKLTQDLRQRE
jgi:hypothetical protein